MQTPRPATVPQPVSEQELEEVLQSLEVELWAQRTEGEEKFSTTGSAPAR